MERGSSSGRADARREEKFPLEDRYVRTKDPKPDFTGRYECAKVAKSSKLRATIILGLSRA